MHNTENKGAILHYCWRYTHKHTYFDATRSVRLRDYSLVCGLGLSCNAK